MSHVLLWYDLHLYLLLGATWQKTICEGREWTFANVCLFSQPCDRSASRRVTLESFKKSVRQLLFLSLVDNYMILMSLLTRFCLFRAPDCFFWRKWAETLQTHFSVSCAVCGNCWIPHFRRAFHTSSGLSWDSLSPKNPPYTLTIPCKTRGSELRHRRSSSCLSISENKSKSIFTLFQCFTYLYLTREWKVTILLSYSSKYFLPIHTCITTIFLGQ